MDTSLEELFREPVLWEKIQELREVHPKWLTEQTFVTSVRARNFEKINYRADHLLSRMFNWHVLQVVGDSDFVVVVLVHVIVMFCSNT